MPTPESLILGALSPSLCASERNLVEGDARDRYQEPVRDLASRPDLANELTLIAATRIAQAIADAVYGTRR